MKTDFTTSTNVITRSEIMQMYYADIPSYNSMTIEEERELFRKYREATTEKEKKHWRDIIINANLLFVVAVAKRYANSENIMDVISEGNIGLLSALETFDPSNENKFASYAVYKIVRAINHFKTYDEPIVKKQNFTKTYHILNKVKETLEKELGRKPRLDEVQEYIDKNIKDYNVRDITDLIDVQITRVDDDTVNEDGNAVNALAMQEFNSYSASENGCIVEEENEFNKAKIRALLSVLKPIEKTIIEYCFGINHYREYSVNEIAEKLDMSNERVRQLKVLAIDKLQKAYLNHKDMSL